MPLDGDIKNFVKTDSEVVTVLKKARALIDSPEKWCKGALERGAARCLRGAILEASDFYKSDVPNAVVWRIERALGFDSGAGRGVCGWDAALPGWYNAAERTHTEVLERIDRAIALAESEHA